MLSRSGKPSLNMVGSIWWVGVMKTAMNNIFMHDQQPVIAMITSLHDQIYEFAHKIHKFDHGDNLVIMAMTDC